MRLEDVQERLDKGYAYSRTDEWGYLRVVRKEKGNMTLTVYDPLSRNIICSGLMRAKGDAEADDWKEGY